MQAMAPERVMIRKLMGDAVVVRVCEIGGIIDYFHGLMLGTQQSPCDTIMWM